MNFRSGRPLAIGKFVQIHGLGKSSDYAQASALLDGIVHTLNAARDAGASSTRVSALLAERDSLADQLVLLEETDRPISSSFDASVESLRARSISLTHRTTPIVLYTGLAVVIASAFAFWALKKGGVFRK